MGQRPVPYTAFSYKSQQHRALWQTCSLSPWLLPIFSDPGRIQSIWEYIWNNKKNQSDSRSVCARSWAGCPHRPPRQTRQKSGHQSASSLFAAIPNTPVGVQPACSVDKRCWIWVSGTHVATSSTTNTPTLLGTNVNNTWNLTDYSLCLFEQGRS
jgi:hypothetical protein